MYLYIASSQQTFAEWGFLYVRTFAFEMYFPNDVWLVKTLTYFLFPEYVN